MTHERQILPLKIQTHELYARYRGCEFITNRLVVPYLYPDDERITTIFYVYPTDLDGPLSLTHSSNLPKMLRLTQQSKTRGAVGWDLTT